MVHFYSSHGQLALTLKAIHSDSDNNSLLIHLKCFEIALRDYVLFCHCAIWTPVLSSVYLNCWFWKNAFRFHFLWLQFYLSKSIILFTGIVSFRCDISPNLIELFWNNTKSLRFVLPLRLSTIALNSVLILKKCLQFYLHRLLCYLSKLIKLSGKAPLNLLAPLNL